MEHHQKIIEKGYWEEPKEIGTLFMLIVTEITKLFDPDRVNKSEKLADIALRIYDLCGYYNIDLTDTPTVTKCNLYDMISMLTNETEAKRVNIDTKWIYLKRLLSMTYLYAELNSINLEYEIYRKSAILIDQPRKLF